MSKTPARRAVVLVIDACGIGALPDAAAYGDEGTNTLAHLARDLGGLELPALGALGLGNVLELTGVPASAAPAIHGRLSPLGPGKDSISGHWELMGVTLAQALPTYPQGFPPELIDRLRRATGHELICNRPDDGLTAIECYGEEHLRSGALILYTSQDSVLQLAAHEQRLAASELYEVCRRARGAMSGKDAVGRVIARPFRGVPGQFVRTAGRRDFSLEPPSRSYLEELREAGCEVAGVGKIDDLFAGRGVSRSHAGATNAQALSAVRELLAEGHGGLIFANLIETDQVYGHRKDREGFAAALVAIDGAVNEIVAGLEDGDLLVVSADHGVDISHAGTDHTREHVPLLAVTGAMIDSAGRDGTAPRVHGGGFRHDGAMADVGASVLRWLTGRDARELPGEPFLS
jgi:phosphopentomutase